MQTEEERTVAVIIEPVGGGILLPYCRDTDAVVGIRVDDGQRVIVRFCRAIEQGGWYSARRAGTYLVPEDEVLAEVDGERIERRTI